MSEPAVRIARVEMPEGGVYVVRAEDGAVANLAPGARAVVAMDYGEDECRVLEVADYDPERDGPRPPSYRLLRPISAADEARIAAHRGEADALAKEFVEIASHDVPDFRLFYARLTLGGDRLFVRFLGGKARADVARAVDELRRKHGISVQVWRSNLREAIAETGPVGPCGRVCCCAGWLSDPHPGTCAAPAPHGLCGRARCCAAFEHEENAR